MSYTPVAHWKAQAERDGVPWAAVAERYSWIRDEQRERLTDVLEIRRRVFTVSGIKKNHPAFWRGDVDLSSIPHFDEVCGELAGTYTWLARDDDPAREVFDLLMPTDSELRTSSDETYEQAIAMCLHEMNHQSSHRTERSNHGQGFICSRDTGADGSRQDSWSANVVLRETQETT